MLAKLAKADGRIDAQEIKIAEKVFDQFKLSAQKRSFCIEVFNTAKTDPQTIYWYAEQLAKHVLDTEVCILVYELLWDVACADEYLHHTEKEILRNICSALHIHPIYYEINYHRRIGSFKEHEGNSQHKTNTSTREKRAQRRPYASGLSSIFEAYEILECESTATTEELKSAHRRIVKRYHPDLLRANGVPDEIISAKSEYLKQVNAAWSDICRERGIT